MVLHLTVLALHVLSDCGLMQLLVGTWVLSVYIDLVVFKYDPFRWVFIKDQVERNLLAFSSRKERVRFHLFPCKSLVRLILHRLVEEIEALKRDFNVSRPCPVSLLDRLV